MSDQNTTVTPPAASGGLTADQVKGLIGEALKSTLSEALKPITTEIGGLQAQLKAQAEKPAAAAAAQGEQLSKADVAKLIADGLAAQNNAQASARAKADFAAKDLKGVPAIYAERLGNDPAKWGEESKAIRETFQADLKAAGVKAPPISSDAGGGEGTKAAGDVIDTSKLSGYELLSMGVKASTPVAAGTAAATSTAALTPASGATAAK